MATADDVIRVAESQLGCTDGSKYFAYFGAGDLGAWCVAGGRWCYAQVGVDCHWNWSFQAFDWRDVPEGYAVEPGDLERGDFVSFDWDDDVKGDHVGIVTGVHDWGISTIEFNTDWGRVAEKQRVWSVVICGIRPSYGGDEWRMSDGRWWYRHSDGSCTKDAWEKIDGKWYFFDEEGWLESGWLHWRGQWYWLHDQHDGHFGEMAESTCVEVDGKWYAFGPTGAMLVGDITNPVHDGTFGSILL